MTEQIQVQGRLTHLKIRQIQQIAQWVLSELQERKLRNKSELQKELTLIFFSEKKARELNLQYRQKDYATDVLSFEGDEFSLGELVFCEKVILRQAREHGLRPHQEWAYLLIHGVLHLLGYDHELKKVEARKMFKIQDEVFDRWMKSHEILRRGRSHVHRRGNLRTQKTTRRS
ncbi:MAG: rRNA maturation RNase YbeY [Proteobacteria bacterium]|nr:rRNA maturation RNase YbeY [Pseudomonadota bacterium]